MSQIPEKQTIAELVSNLPDKEKYNAVIYVGLDGVRVSNLGVAGSLPQGADPRQYLFSKLQEALQGIAFSGNG